MNKLMNRFCYGILAVSLAVPATMLRADESGANPIKHPKIAYDQHEIKADQKDIRDDHDKIRMNNEQEELAKKDVSLNKKKYERAVKSYGPNSDLTKEAQARYEKSEKTYADAHQANLNAKQQLAENRLQLQHTQRELSENKTAEKEKIGN